MTEYFIRCTRSDEPLWRERFTHEGDAIAYWHHKVKLSREVTYDPPYRLEFWMGEKMLDVVETNA
jgi:hypothetical protein